MTEFVGKFLNKIDKLTEIPKGGRGFLGFPLHTDLNNLDADIAILGVPYGLPYTPDDLSNDQSMHQVHN